MISATFAGAVGTHLRHPWVTARSGYRNTAKSPETTVMHSMHPANTAKGVESVPTRVSSPSTTALAPDATIRPRTTAAEIFPQIDIAA